MNLRLYSCYITVILALSLFPINSRGSDTTVPVSVTGNVVRLSNDAKTSYDFTIPDQKIDTKPQFDPGDVIVVKAGQITSQVPYLVAATYRWRVLEGDKEKEVQEWPDGTSILFGAGVTPGRKFKVILSISYLYVVKENDKGAEHVVAIGQRSTLLTTDITVAGLPAPIPTPGPGPMPSPVPVPDGTKYGLTTKAYQLATTIAPVNNRARTAAALASSFNGMASSASAGTIPNVREFLSQTTLSNKAALASVGANPIEWDAFFTALQKEIYTPYLAGKLSTLSDFKEAWLEIAAGLEKVK